MKYGQTAARARNWFRLSKPGKVDRITTEQGTVAPSETEPSESHLSVAESGTAESSTAEYGETKQSNASLDAKESDTMELVIFFDDDSNPTDMIDVLSREHGVAFRGDPTAFGAYCASVEKKGRFSWRILDALRDIKGISSVDENKDVKLYEPTKSDSKNVKYKSGWKGYVDGGGGWGYDY